MTQVWGMPIEAGDHRTDIANDMIMQLPAQLGDLGAANDTRTLNFLLCSLRLVPLTVLLRAPNCLHLMEAIRSILSESASRVAFCFGRT